MPRREQRRSAFAAAPPPPVSYFGDAEIELQFDYGQVDEAHRDNVRAAARVIKPRLKRAAEDIFVIGRELQSVREFLPYGSYVNWLDIEFGLSVRQAYRFVNVAERLSSSFDKLSKLPPSTLYMLAAPSTPDEAIAAVEERLDAGERIRVALVRDVIARARQEQSASRTTIEGKVVEDARTAATRKLEHLLGQAVAILVDDTLLQTDEREAAQAMLVELRRTLRQRMAE